jgi:hypothetical protein
MYPDGKTHNQIAHILVDRRRHSNVLIFNHTGQQIVIVTIIWWWHKPWFDEGCSKVLDQRKQAKLQWLQDPSEINGDNLNNVRREASRYFRNKKNEHLKDKINELATNSKNKNIRDLCRGINGFKRGYQPRNNLVKDENDVLLADSHNILNRWKNYFSQLLNVHNVSDVRQIPYFMDYKTHFFLQKNCLQNSGASYTRN